MSKTMKRNTAMVNITDRRSPIRRPEKILQFGEGNFLRAFADWMFDIANETTGFNGNVVLVQPIRQGMADMINNQNGLYTTVIRGIQDGEQLEELRLIDSVSRCINPYIDYESYIECAENPELRFIVSNTTEAGIAWCPTDRLKDLPQSSFPGKVAAFLYRRYRHFNGDETKGLIIIPCELIDKNGDKLKEYVLQHAKGWNLGAAFIGWIDSSCSFCNTLVDRIVPGFPTREAEKICKDLGYTDNLLAAAEIFHLWVIESQKDFRHELPLHLAGLNVIWTDDLSFYRTRKVRILNGGHTMSVAAAYLYGLNTVDECIHDKLMLRFMRQGIFNEIIPSMEGDQKELKKYAEDVLERFANPYVRHMLLSITLNSISKFKTRVLPSLTSYIHRYDDVPPALAFSLSALIAFYEGTSNKEGRMTGAREGNPYDIQDDQAVIDRFSELYSESTEVDNKADRLVKAVLSETAWWEEDLSFYPGLEEAVRNGLESIWAKGMKETIRTIFGT